MRSTPVRFRTHTSATAPRAAADRLRELEDRHGHVGEMVATMAGSPSMIAGYLDLSRAVKRTRLPRAVTERISLAVQESLDCSLCLTAHTQAALAAGVSVDETELARLGTSADPAVAPIVSFAQRVHTAPASIVDADIDALRTLGLADRDVLDIVALVSLNVLTGTFNLVAGLESDLAATA
ncbi:MAG: carboxymuconolactone decarboxylase family protein [Acidimicrobiales bacterium]|nr:carboxymuconolactone decarboxylase family protein [Acidimicrobiales bacterium]